MIDEVAVAVVFTNRVRKFRNNGTSENWNFRPFSHVFKQPQKNDQNEVGRLISQLQLGVYSESHMRICIKIERHGCGNRRDFENLHMSLFLD